MSKIRQILLGSSPRLWGTLKVDDMNKSLGRFIPTAVGNASRNAMSTAPTAVHPHGCGERAYLRPEDWFMAGSSPRLWGTLDGRQADIRQGRFIPTAVGNAGGIQRKCWATPVHPHGCGERAIRRRD